MRRAEYIVILRPTAREFDGELWAFAQGDELAVGELDLIEEPPTIPQAMALDLLRARDAEVSCVRDIGADLELVGEAERDAA